MFEPCQAIQKNIFLSRKISENEKSDAQITVNFTTVDRDEVADVEHRLGDLPVLPLQFSDMM